MGSATEAVNILKQIRHPRDLHIFMMELIKELNENCLHSQKPFIATIMDSKNAMMNSKKLLFRENDS